MLRRLVFLSFLLVLSGLVGAFTAAPASAGTSSTPGGLTGETFTGTDYEFQGSVISCDPTGDTTFTLLVTGDAAGPYPGTFEETLTVTIGPQAEGGTGTVTQFDATFTITSPAGTVTGAKHLSPNAGPAFGQCSSTPTVPNPVCPPIASESFSLTTTYDAAVSAPGGTSSDQGTSPVSFDGLQEQCSPEAPTHVGTFAESFASTAGPPQCAFDDHNGGGGGGDQGDRGRHGGRNGCQPCSSSGDENDGHGSGNSCDSSGHDSNGGGRCRGSGSSHGRGGDQSDRRCGRDG